MNTALLITVAAGPEWAGRHGPPWGDGPPHFFAPVIGVVMCLILFLLIAAAFFMLRKGKGRPPWVAGPEAPETAAKRLLSERFARGDISTDEFMERASVLNWTPGSDPSDGKRR